MDIRSRRYNPKGVVELESYIFEFPERSFDTVVLSSVFTHIRWQNMAHYLKKFARMLKNGGRVVFTAVLYDLLLTPQSSPAQDDTKRFQPIPEAAPEPEWTWNLEEPERCTAFTLQSVERALELAGLRLVGELCRGRWTGNPSYYLWQDVVAAEKTKTGE